MAKIFLAFGSNMGNRRQNILAAISVLERQGVCLIRLSSFIETDPLGGPPQGRYLNAVGQLETVLDPRELLLKCLSIEALLGRIRTVPDGPRSIDIDILLYDNVSISQEDLVIPHPRMTRRDFVMGPLSEIAPDVAKKLKL